MQAVTNPVQPTTPQTSVAGPSRHLSARQVLLTQTLPCQFPHHSHLHSWMSPSPNVNGKPDPSEKLQLVPSCVPNPCQLPGKTGSTPTSTWLVQAWGHLWQEAAPQNVSCATPQESHPPNCSCQMSQPLSTPWVALSQEEGHGVLGCLKIHIPHAGVCMGSAAGCPTRMQFAGQASEASFWHPGKPTTPVFLPSGPPTA